MNIEEYMEFYSNNKRLNELKTENNKLRKALEDTLDEMGALINGWKILAEMAQTDEGTKRALLGAIYDTWGQFNEYSRKKKEVL